jgi:hypothetical protein
MVDLRSKWVVAAQRFGSKKIPDARAGRAEPTAECGGSQVSALMDRFPPKAIRLAWGPGINGLRHYEGNIEFGTGVGPGRSVSVCDMIAG